MELRGNIITRLKQCNAYADNILLTTRTKHSLLETYQKLKETSAQYGLIVNGQKTKYLRCTRKNHKLEELQINLMYLEQVQSYKYLGSTVNSGSSIEEEIQYRITLRNKAYYSDQFFFNPLNPELNPICYLLALLGAHHFLHVSKIRVKLLTFRLLMSYIHGAPILDVSRSHTTTQHSR